MSSKDPIQARLESILEGGSPRRQRAKGKKANGAHRPRAKGAADEKPNMLITGVAHYWGERMALRMEKDSDFGSVHGIDVDRPRVNFRRSTFTHLDIRSPMILDFLISRKIDTVVHLMQAEEGDAEEVFQRSVMATMFLISACADAGVRNVILMSETAVYGFSSTNPASIKESRYLQKKNSPFLDRNLGQNPHLSNLLEIEKFVFRFRSGQAARGDEAMRIVPLRFAPILGPRCNTWMTRYLREPVIPTALGFDPLVQLVHEDDVLRALYAAAKSDVDGPVNIAAPGVLTLHQLIRRVGKTWVPFAHSLGNFWRKLRKSFTGDSVAPLGMSSLKFSCIGDLTRMREELGFLPRKGAAECLEHFAEHRRMARYYHEAEPDALFGKYTEDALKQILAPDSLGMEDA